MSCSACGQDPSCTFFVSTLDLTCYKRYSPWTTAEFGAEGMTGIAPNSTVCFRATARTSREKGKGLGAVQGEGEGTGGWGSALGGQEQGEG